MKESAALKHVTGAAGREGVLSVSVTCSSSDYSWVVMSYSSQLVYVFLSCRHSGDIFLQYFCLLCFLTSQCSFALCFVQQCGHSLNGNGNNKTYLSSSLSPEGALFLVYLASTNSFNVSSFSQSVKLSNV